jgi:glyoxylase-like metal-dependent hydrolase (beta-lactamase superfamily II)
MNRSKIAAITGSALGFACAGWTHAAAPMVKTQAPGFYRFMLGDFEVTALNDGVVAYPTTHVLPKATSDEINRRLAENDLTDPVDMSYNAFLINTGHKLVLIDTGTGGKLNDDPGFHGAGHLMANLRAAGYQAQQIDEIYITHLGPDHVGGLTLGNDRAFPNAIAGANSGGRPLSPSCQRPGLDSKVDSVLGQFVRAIHQGRKISGHRGRYRADTRYPSAGNTGARPRPYVL